MIFDLENGRFHFSRIQFCIKNEKNDGCRECGEPRMTHLLARRAHHDSDAIPARSTSCRVPLFVSYAQLPAVQEMSHPRCRKIHDAVVTLHHRANCRQGSSAQSLRDGRSDRPSTRSRCASQEHGHDARYWLPAGSGLPCWPSGNPTTSAATGVAGSARMVPASVWRL